MSTVPIIFILIFFFIFIRVIFYQLSTFNTLISHEKFLAVAAHDITVVDKYVPLGHHFNFSCDAFERIHQKLFLPAYSVHWIFRRSKHSIILDNNPNLRFIYDENSYHLIGYDIQREHEGILECRIAYNNSNYNVIFEIQDCDESIDSNITHSLRNPCQFGQCTIVSAKLGGIIHEKLYCDCVEQYTGLYCDVEKIGTWWREMVYYSSTFGHFICTGIIFLTFYCFDRLNAKERISLKDDVPDFERIRENKDLLYPAARKRQPPSTRTAIPLEEGIPAA